MVGASERHSSFQELKRYKVADAATWAAPAISENASSVKDVSSVALFTLPYGVFDISVALAHRRT